MDYDDIKEKILGWLKEKENFDDKDIYFLFKDLAEEAWELVKGGEVEADESLDPDSLEGFGEELPGEDEGPEEDDDEAEPVRKPFKKIDLDADEELDDDEGVEDEDDKPPLPSFDKDTTTKKTPVYAKKPRIKPK